MCYYQVTEVPFICSNKHIFKIFFEINEEVHLKYIFGTIELKKLQMTPKEDCA